MVKAFFVAAFLLVLAVACTPTHNIKPLPNFVKVGLAPGDRVTITKHDGATYEFVVTEVRGDILISGDEEFLLHDIAAIQKHAWERPESPCGGEKPLGCSVPILVSLASDTHSHYGDKFYEACAQHDYCYRHGFASYGLDRNSCDDAFLKDMQNSCPHKARGTLGGLFEALDSSMESRQSCLTAANDFYAAVRRYGEDKFETNNSTYCEFDGPPVRGAKSANGTFKMN